MNSKSLPVLKTGQESASGFIVLGIFSDQPVTLTTISAVYRSLAVASLKGNRLAAKTFVEHVEKAEMRLRVQAMESAEQVAKYKIFAEGVIEDARRHGRPEPKIYPHPDDIIFCDDGRIVVVGPATAAEAAHWEKLQKRAACADASVTMALVEWKSQSKRDAGIKRFAFDEMVSEHRIRLMLRFAAPDEATRRAHRYRRPSAADMDALIATNKAKYRLHHQLTETERAAVVREIELYQRRRADF